MKGMAVDAARLGPARWRGQSGRLEVWYATLTDPASGDGWWIHHEIVAPTDDGPAYAHGWLASFPAGGQPPGYERFGPGPPASQGWFGTADVLVDEGVLRGPGWDLRFQDDAEPLYTFPKTVWDRELLPAAQIVPFPAARFDGCIGDRELAG